MFYPNLMPDPLVGSTLRVDFCPYREHLDDLPSDVRADDLLAMALASEVCAMSSPSRSRVFPWRLEMLRRIQAHRQAEAEASVRGCVALRDRVFRGAA